MRVNCAVPPAWMSGLTGPAGLPCAPRTANAVDGRSRLRHCSCGLGMERIFDALAAWFTVFLESLGNLAGGTIRLFETPASMVGLPVEIFAAALVCLVLIALWRTMSRYIM
jgi:hypothetical protein